MAHKFDKITENTLIPISLISSIIGGIVWISSVSFQTTANAKNIDVIEARQEDLTDKQELQNKDIIERLSRIEGYLKRK